MLPLTNTFSFLYTRFVVLIVFITSLVYREKIKAYLSIRLATAMAFIAQSLRALAAVRFVIVCAPPGSHNLCTANRTIGGDRARDM